MGAIKRITISYTCDMCREEVDRDRLRAVGSLAMQTDLMVDICDICTKRPISDLLDYLQNPLQFSDRFQETEVAAGLTVRHTLERG